LTDASRIANFRHYDHKNQNTMTMAMPTSAKIASRVGLGYSFQVRHQGLRSRLAEIVTLWSGMVADLLIKNVADTYAD
jgi:hypothetical protein